MTACRSHKMRSVSISCSHSCTDHGTRKCYALVQKGSTWYRKSRTIAFNSIIIAASPEHIEFAYQRSARPDRWSLKRSAISGSSLHHVHNRLYCDKQGQSQHYSTLFSLSPLLLFIFFYCIFLCSLPPLAISVSLVLVATCYHRLLAQKPMALRAPYDADKLPDWVLGALPYGVLYPKVLRQRCITGSARNSLQAKVCKSYLWGMEPQDGFMGWISCDPKSDGTTNNRAR